MHACRDIEPLLTRWVDGEVSGSDVAAVRAHLETCRACRASAAAQRAVRERLRAAAPELVARAPAALWARCAAALEAVAPPVARGRLRRAVGWAPLAAAAVLLLVALGVTIEQRVMGGFVAQLAIDHDKCFPAPPPPAPAFGAPDARMQLAAIVGADVAVPLESPEFDLLDVQECDHERGSMGHVRCLWRGAAVSLFVVPDRSYDERLLEIVRHDALVWSDDRHAYVLVAERGLVDFGQVARHVRQAMH